VALHDYPPGDEPAELPDDNLVQIASRGFDPAKLAPRFTERLVVCPYCHDRAYVTVTEQPFGVQPCPACRRGDAVHGGWWKEAAEQRSRRGTGPEANALLANVPSEEEPPI
jgi:hypothetical protein